MYDQSSVLIVSVLFLCMLLSVEIGFRIRSRQRKQAVAAEAIAQANAVLVSMLGLLALLLAFTFSAALQRYDDRSQAVVAEANAIGTTYLRVRLLPAAMQDDVRGLVRQYLDIRIQEGRVEFSDIENQELLQRQAMLVRSQIWDRAVRAAEQDRGSIATALFIQSLNELIDSSGVRKAANSRHVPEIVIFLMFATVVMSTGTLGFASGIAGHRITLAAFVLMMLIALVVYLIIDLDRPRRGAIQVSQESMLSLQQSIGDTQGHAGQSGNPASRQ